MSWKKVETPKKKADWRYKILRLQEVPPSCRYDGAHDRIVPQLPIQIGDVAKIERRRDISEVNWWMSQEQKETFGKRVLELVWICPHCDHPHHLIIPESWIAEGKACFVEAEE